MEVFSASDFELVGSMDCSICGKKLELDNFGDIEVTEFFAGEPSCVLIYRVCNVHVEEIRKRIRSVVIDMREGVN